MSFALLFSLLCPSKPRATEPCVCRKWRKGGETTTAGGRRRRNHKPWYLAPHMVGKTHAVVVGKTHVMAAADQSWYLLEPKPQPVVCLPPTRAGTSDAGLFTGPGPRRRFPARSASPEPHQGWGTRWRTRQPAKWQSFSAPTASRSCPHYRRRRGSSGHNIRASAGAAT